MQKKCYVSHEQLFIYFFQRTASKLTFLLFFFFNRYFITAAFIKEPLFLVFLSEKISIRLHNFYANFAAARVSLFSIIIIADLSIHILMWYWIVFNFMPISRASIVMIIWYLLIVKMITVACNVPNCEIEFFFSIIDLKFVFRIKDTIIMAISPYNENASQVSIGKTRQFDNKIEMEFYN